MDETPDPLAGKVLQESIPVLTDAHDVKMINMPSVSCLVRQRKSLNAAESRVVSSSVGPTLIVGLSQALEFGAENGALDAVHAGVPTDGVVLISSHLAVFPKADDAFAELAVVGDHGAGLPESAEVLCGVEAKATGVTQASRFAAFVECAVGLASVFDDEQRMLFSDFENGVHIGRLAEEVDGDDGASPLRNGRLEFGRVHREGAFVDVDEDRSCAAHADGFDRGDKGVRNRYDFISRANSQREKSEPKRVRSVADTGGEVALAKCGEVAFEGAHERPAGEGVGPNDFLNALLNLPLERFIFDSQIDEWDLHLKAFALSLAL